MLPACVVVIETLKMLSALAVAGDAGVAALSRTNTWMNVPAWVLPPCVAVTVAATRSPPSGQAGQPTISQVSSLQVMLVIPVAVVTVQPTWIAFAL